MELQKDLRPKMASFTATVDTRIVADNGTKCTNFEAGETKSIHRDLFTAAIAAGLMPEGTLELKAPVVVENKTQEQTVHDGLVAACKELIALGEPKNFLITGQPRAASLKKLVDFQFTAKDAERAFGQAVHEVGTNGDDSKEHSESILDVTE